MKQADLNRAVARATGESLDVVSRMGFQEIVMPVARRVVPVIGQLPRRLHVERTKRKPAVAA